MRTNALTSKALQSSIYQPFSKATPQSGRPQTLEGDKFIEIQPVESSAPSRQERLQAALKCGIKSAFSFNAFKHTLKISAVIAIATCWLPGPQLIIIPAFLLFAAVFRGLLGGMVGYQNPQGSEEFLTQLRKA